MLRSAQTVSPARTIGYPALLAWLCLTVAGCAPQSASLPPAEALSQLRTGRPLLNCRELCLAEWRQVQPQAAQLDVGARWQDLALLLVRVGYQDDLSLYYLGRAAEGIGARVAAAAYYRQSMELSGTSISCQNLSRLCGDVALPRAASLRVAAIERELARARQPRRSGPAPPGGEPPEMPPEEMAAPMPIPEPMPATATRAAPTPAPTPSSPRPAPTEFIEPPPAPR